GRFREERAPAVVAELARLYERERQTGESFRAFVDRVGDVRLARVAAEVAGEAGRGGARRSPGGGGALGRGAHRAIAGTGAPSPGSTTGARAARSPASRPGASTTSSTPSCRSSAPSHA